MLEVRSAHDDDLEAIARLQAARNGPECDAMVRSLWVDDDCGPGRFTVAADDGTVVSSLCLIPGTLRLGGVEIPVGQPEFVATATTHGHQGLVRRQFDLVHQWSADAGHLTQLIAGIPYFYRRFGYEYAITMPSLRLLLPGTDVSMPDGWSVRPAAVDDLPTILDFERSVQELSELTMSRSDTWWRWWIAHPEQTMPHVAVRDGRIEASGSIGVAGPGVHDNVVDLIWIGGRHPDGLRALVAHAAVTGAGKPVAFEDRDGLASILRPQSTVHPRQYALYVRVADPVALLNHLRPVLSQRLAASPFAAARGDLLLSSYARSLVISYENGEVTEITAGGPEQDPWRRGGAGMPPDQLATLIFGRYGALGLDERYDDVRLGPAAALMDVLFPAVTNDIVLPL